MASIKVLLLLVVFVLHSASSEVLTNYRTPTEDSFIQASNRYASLMLPNLPDFQDLLKEITNNESIALSNDCRMKLSFFSKGLKERSLEAMTIFSSYSNGQPGFFTDRISDFGHYRQCLYSKFNGSNTRYFLIQVTHPGHEIHPKPWHKRDQFVDVVHPTNFRPAPILHAICLPSECSRQDVEGLLKDDVVNSRISPLRLSIYSSESFDDPDPFQEYRLPRFVAKTIVFSLVVLTIMATLKILPNNSIVQAWNAVENHKKIFSGPSSFPDDRLYVFNFYKTVYMLAIMATHLCYGFTMKAAPYLHAAGKSALPFGYSLSQSVTTLAVSGNFIVSAGLAVLTVIPMLPKLSFSMFVVGRALRTMPVLIMVTLIMIAFPFFDGNPFGRGPLYLEMHKNISGNCAINGWRDVMFLTTSLRGTSMCSVISWFITVDFRIYVLSFLTMVFLAKSPKIGLSLLALQAMVGTLIHYWSLQVNNVFPPITVGFESSDRLIEIWETTYFDTRGHISSYCVGMAFGYVILKTKKRASVSVTHVVLSLTALLGCIYSFISIYDLRTQESILSYQQQLLFASTIRFFYVSSFAYLFYSLLNSDAMISFCKKGIFAIGSRFAFSTFMIHQLFISYFQSTLTRLPEYSYVYILSMYLFVLVSSLVSGYLIMILVEYPFGNFLKMALKEKNKVEKFKE